MNIINRKGAETQRYWLLVFHAKNAKHYAKVLDGLMKTIESDSTATVEYSSGLQISSTFSDVLIYGGHPIYINTNDPTTLNYKNKLIKGEGYFKMYSQKKRCFNPTYF